MILLIHRSKRFHGQVVLSYFILYALLRTIVEMFRGDSIRGFILHWPEKGHEMLLSTSQGVSLIVALGGIGLTWFIIRQKNRASMFDAAPKPA